MSNNQNSCGKVQYRTQKEANTAKNTLRLRSQNAKKQIPKRAYYCDNCRKWHLTHYLKK